MNKENQRDQSTHPSYGIVEVGRASGGRENLFGSSASTGNYISLTISLASAERDPERHVTNYFPERRILEIALTPLQFALMMTSASGGEGVPCTVIFRDGQMVKQDRSATTERQFLEDEFQHEMASLGKGCDEILTTARALRDKANVNKGDRDSFVKMAEGLVAKIVAAQPYIASRFSEYVEDILAEQAAAKVTGGQSSPGSSPAGR